MSQARQKILVVEDDVKLSNLVCKSLADEGYAAEPAYDGDSALGRVGAEKFDVVILDIVLPGTDGFGVLKELRRRGVATPVIVLTARDTVRDRIRGLDGGADDYLVKPFSFAELLARVRAVLRRSSEPPASLLKYGGLEMDLVKRKVARDGKEIELTTREFDLLEYFMRNSEQVLTRTMILQEVWGYAFDGMSNVLDVYINYLRNSIDAGWDEKLLHTVRGTGYVLRRGTER